ncbi:hypothetical protein GALL_250780 [mine drainage metagenome]|uniref:Outer membrane protein beta-barrel domain-containing protein n=1 Tax=mine drainage metagenome TaxID=410659 RepID=A0A1J5RLU2_9ZZZZ
MRSSCFAAALVLASLCAATADAASPVDIGVTAGTLGYGPQVGVVLVPRTFDARLNFGDLSYSYNTTSSDVYYDGHLKLQNLGLLGDWHPFAGSFRLTAGLFYNDNKFDLAGTPTAGQTYTVNGASYTAQPGDHATARVDFNKLATYIGFGWGDASDSAGLHFTSDIGVMYQGKPSAHIDVTTQPAYQSAANQYAQAAQSSLQSDLNNFRWYPVIQLGLVYRF